MAVDKTPNTLPTPSFDKPVKLLIVTAPYNKAITDDLLAGAKATLDGVGVKFDTVEVPGALEIPTAIAIAERLSNFDGYVVLGCLKRRKSGSFKAMSNATFRAISQLGLNGICIGNGILTVGKSKRDSASDRECGGNAANAALHLVALSRKWGRETKGMGFLPASSEFQMADSSDNGPDTA